MLTNETTRKLQEMHLVVMAKAFTTQLSDNQVSALSFEDRFALLVDAEWAARKSNHLKRLIKKADFADPGACIEDIEYLPGATGAGKTYIACALGIAANRNLYTVRYIRLPDLLVEIAMARGDGTYREYMKKLKKVKLLILDEWLLYPLKESEARDVLELVEARSKTASTIFCSQYDTSEWHENLYDSNLADAICDRIIYDAYTIQIEGESMRKRKGIIE